MNQGGGIDVNEVFNVSIWTESTVKTFIPSGIDSINNQSLVWVKARSASATGVMFDTLRGPQNYLVTSTGAPEVVTPIAYGSGFYADGYDMRQYSSGTNAVGWQWRQSEKFFDVVQYTGNGTSRQIPHTLSVSPGVVFVKRTSGTGDWQVYHRSLGATQYSVLNTTAALGAASNRWNDTEPTSAEFTVGTDSTVNATGQSYIAYLFAHDTSSLGVIQCGSYIGNGSATGPDVNLGWRPQYLMIKNSTSTGDWQIIDASRGFTATNDAILLANTNGAETSANLVNPSSTGFQLASTASNVNTSGQTYIYMAIREAP